MASHSENMLVCPRCGWQQLLGHERTCWPEAGAAAQRLIDFLALQNIKATKLGHGQHRVAFTTARDTATIVLGVAHDGSFSVDYVRMDAQLNEADAGKLATVLELFAQARGG